jgi:DNA repair protein RecO (recombination protein O)
MATNKSARRGSEPLEAFVLHSYNWSETSLILEVLTCELGRLTVAAKGAKRPYSQLRSVLRPFQRIHVQLNRGTTSASTTNIHVLRQAEWMGSSHILMGERLFSGFYLNELLLKFLPHEEPHERLFETYASTLHELTQASTESELQSWLRAFEFLLLREMGHLPDLSLETLSNQAILKDKFYALNPELGLTTDEPNRSTYGERSDTKLPGYFWLALEDALQQSSSKMLQLTCLPHLQCIKSITRILIQTHLGPGSLHSRDVYTDVLHFHETSRTLL